MTKNSLTLATPPRCVITYKDKISGSLNYGRNSYDYKEGTLLFMAPGQVFQPPTKKELELMKIPSKGWTLMFHSDLLRKSNLGSNIDNYTFFSYEVSEALHLSANEEEFILSIVNKIEEEYSQNIDQHSQGLIISNLELLLNYCTRFMIDNFILVPISIKIL